MVGPSRGIIEDATERPFRHARRDFAEDLRHLVRHAWIIEWDLPAGRSHVQEVLPHPTGQLVLERGSSRVVGVYPGRFAAELKGRGMVFGFALRPGAIGRFTRAPAWESTGREEPLSTVFGDDALALEERVLGADDDGARVALAEAFLRAHLPPRDLEAERTGAVVEMIERDRSLIRVEDVAALAELDVRALQRMFRRDIGVSPKWVIRRYRVHEALERMKSGHALDPARLATDLGYADQAHFTKDFRALVGRTPGAYARAARRAGPG